MVEIRLIPLGTCAANSTSLQEQSSYLLEVSDSDYTASKIQIVLDAASRNLIRPGIQNTIIDPKSLKMILLSHAHKDHTKYLGRFIGNVNRALNQQGGGIKNSISLIMHPQAWKKQKKQIMRANGLKIPEIIVYKPIKLSKRKHSYTNLDEKFEFPQFTYQFPNGKLNVKVEAVYAIHSCDCVAYKISISHSISDPSVVIVYSPDTRCSSEHLTDFAQNADYWLLDSTFDEASLKCLNKLLRRCQLHSSPVESAKLCQKARVRNYVVVHYFWTRFLPISRQERKNISKCQLYLMSIDEILTNAREFFEGTILVSQDLRPIILYRSNSL